MDKANGWQKIKLTPELIQRNLESFKNHPDFVMRIQATLASKPEFPPAIDAESALYEGFLDDRDKLTCMAVRNNGAEDLRNFRPKVNDPRLGELILHYKAKNYPSSLNEDEIQQWETYRLARLNRQAPKFLAELNSINATLAKGKTYNGKSKDECRYLAEELKLWYESLQPGDY